MKNNQTEAAYSIEDLEVSISSIGNDLDLVEEFVKEDSVEYFVINI
ncbi:hypothetical protein [Salinimicrobium gaetbulicola]|uniref:Uncharacterized protein n=1 Tax=Salinimicrobium gaetbulicola TaxID=999702 RepID=A0ABW3IGF4_9FLAO